MTSSRPSDGAHELVIASNRLPMSVTLAGGEVGLSPSSGGLVSALRGTDQERVWVGWPGITVPDELQEEVTRQVTAQGCRPVFLSDAEQDAFYAQICNDTLWPLFHYFVDRLHFTQEAWESYVEVNERFAETIAGLAAPGARVWVHDFHLTLVPAALRRRRPDLAIGFFLHIPFPSSEIYRLLPARDELLRGLLGSDYVAFHTGDYARHFRSSCLRILGIEAQPDSIELDGRTVGVGVHPIGIDVRAFRKTLRSRATARIENELEERYRGRQLLLGVERLDYTKGIPEKLDAFERILEQDPERAKTTVMLQVVVPSRLDSFEYQSKLEEIEVRIAHVNGRFGGFGYTPIEYVHRSISHPELAAIYRRADVMVVTPIRDGMNLVAQEFVLCQTAGPPRAESSGPGVLLLSEFAGAAYALPGALLVNPWDANGLTTRILEALALDPAERLRRIELMADRVVQLDCRNWATSFLARLDRYAALPKPQSAPQLDPHKRERIVRKLAGARSRVLLLDYDGTLRELVGHPDLAAPTREIRDLLRDLASLPRTSVHLISGRTHDTLDAWFGDLPVNLGAEHGYLARAVGGDWHTAVDADLSWLPRIERLFRRVAADVPGTLVERKRASVTWHYRQAEPEYGAWRAHEVLSTLEHVLAGVSAEVLPGHQVIEVRARGINKGLYLQHALAAEDGDGQVILAAGDDRTDLDLFRALPRNSIALHVGRRMRTHEALLGEQYSVASPEALRSLLRSAIKRIRPAAAR